MADTPQARFRTIDGLRGVAALAVVLFHFYPPVAQSLASWTPDLVEGLFYNGHFGVDVFFVISGFVIAYSVRDGDFTPSYLLRFAGRRSLRLDPPYWVAIAMEVCIVYVGLRIMPGVTKAVPSQEQILAHLMYAQNFLGVGDISAVFWTLAYEIQFYLFTIVLLIVWQALRHRAPARARAAAAFALLGGLLLLSLATRFGGVEALPGLAIDRWYQFFLGVLVWWVVAGHAPLASLLLAWGAVAVTIAMASVTPLQLIVVGVSAFILVVARLGRLETMLGGQSWQFLGKTSYSLYLYHLPVGGVIMAVGLHLAGDRPSAAVALLLFALTVAGSVVAGAVGWKLLEEPSMRWSRRIEVPRRRTERAPRADAPPLTAPAPAPALQAIP